MTIGLSRSYAPGPRKLFLSGRLEAQTVHATRATAAATIALVIHATS
jgi:hypothetical protein